MVEQTFDKLKKTFSTEKLEDYYVIEKHLGEGGFGSVQLGHPKNNDQLKVAIKTIQKKDAAI